MEDNIHIMTKKFGYQYTFYGVDLYNKWGRFVQLRSFSSWRREILCIPEASFGYGWARVAKVLLELDRYRGSRLRTASELKHSFPESKVKIGALIDFGAVSKELRAALNATPISSGYNKAIEILVQCLADRSGEFNALIKEAKVVLEWIDKFFLQSEQVEFSPPSKRPKGKDAEDSHLKRPERKDAGESEGNRQNSNQSKAEVFDGIVGHSRMSWVGAGGGKYGSDGSRGHNARGMQMWVKKASIGKHSNKWLEGLEGPVSLPNTECIKSSGASKGNSNLNCCSPRLGRSCIVSLGPTKEQEAEIPNVNGNRPIQVAQKHEFIRTDGKMSPQQGVEPDRKLEKVSLATHLKSLRAKKILKLQGRFMFSNRLELFRAQRKVGSIRLKKFMFGV